MASPKSCAAACHGSAVIAKATNAGSASPLSQRPDINSTVRPEFPRRLSPPAGKLVCYNAATTRHPSPDIICPTPVYAAQLDNPKATNESFFAMPISRQSWKPFRIRRTLHNTRKPMARRRHLQYMAEMHTPCQPATKANNVAIPLKVSGKRSSSVLAVTIDFLRAEYSASTLGVGEAPAEGTNAAINPYARVTN